MASFVLILVVLAFLCELLAAVGVPDAYRWRLVAGGLAAYFLSLLVPR